MQRFCEIAFSYSVESDWLEELDSNYLKIVRLCFLLEQNHSSVYKKAGHFEVFSKLHVLKHYQILMQTWGPLSHFSTMKYERMHQLFKRLYETLKSRKNILYSFAFRHQKKFAMNLISTNFQSFDYFPKACPIESILMSHIPNGAIKLKASDCPAFLSVHPEIIYRINYGRHMFWLRCKSFYSDKSTGSVYAEGLIFEAITNMYLNFRVLKVKYKSMYVNVKNILPRKDFFAEFKTKNLTKFVLIKSY